jgi:hypothetical protein
VFIIATRLQVFLAVRIVLIVYLILLQLVGWLYGMRGIVVIGLLTVIGLAIYEFLEKKRVAPGPLRQAMDLAQAGKKTESRIILAELIRSEPQNELAWIWYADTWADTETRVQVLGKQKGGDVERR